jgi:hypothetical protein
MCPKNHEMYLQVFKHVLDSNANGVNVLKFSIFIH